MIINQQGLLKASPIENMETVKERSNGVSFGLAEAGYDIRIAEDVTFSPDTEHGFVTYVNGERNPGRFTLASSMERFTMPTNLVGVVHDKSTHARRGLSVFNTVIEPGWEGILTLELIYHGPDMLHLGAGTGIAQILFSKVETQAQYDGKYQNQEAGAQVARYE